MTALSKQIINACFFFLLLFSLIYDMSSHFVWMHELTNYFLNYLRYVVHF